LPKFRQVLKKAWAYNRDDFAAVLATIVLTLAVGVEVGVASGVTISILLHGTVRQNELETGRAVS
jgi:SulP family sulfate permease